MATVGERIRARRKEIGLRSQAALADKVGVSQATINYWETDKNGPAGENLLNLARALRTSPDWIIGGKGDAADSEQAPEHLPVTVWDAPDDLDPEQHVIVPRVQVRFSAGPGHEVSYDPDLHDKGNAYRADWIRRKGLDPKRLIVVLVDGESMSPTLPDGSAMTTDTRANTLDQVVNGKIYAIRYGNELRVKRLSRRYDGALIIDSDNPAFPREIVEPEHLEHIGIIGRYVAHSYDGDL